jgi:hypothetical protein
VPACNGNINRACDFTINDAVLHVVAATDARTGTALGDILIKDIRFGGVLVGDARRLIDIAPFAKGVTADGGQIRCTVSCAFAVDQGRYEFTVSKPGYQDLPVSIDARFKNVDGDCERTLSGGVEVSIQLVPL